MSALDKFEDAMADLLAERTTGDNDRRPIIAYVLYAVTTDPITMRDEDPEWIIPTGQPQFSTRGLIEDARSELLADKIGSLTYSEWEDDDGE